MFEKTADKRLRRRRVMILSVLLMFGCSMVLPLTGYLLVDDIQAQDTTNEEAKTAGDDDVNPRAAFWREVRQGTAGYSAVTGQEANVLIQNGGQNWRQIRNGPIATIGAWAILGIIGVLAVYHLITGGYKMPDRTGRKVLRWPAADRAIHWTMAVLFIILAITGMSLLWGRAVLIPVMGKEVFAGWAQIAKPIHDYLSLPFALMLIVALLKWLRHNIPKAYDIEWLLKGGGYLGGGHPPAGFSNAGEKALYWTLVIAGGGLIVSGFFLLFPNLGTVREDMQLHNIIHGITAVVCITFVCLHIYLATIGSEGALEGMLHGYVDERYAMNHHPLWWDEIKDQKGARETSRGGAPSPAPAAPRRD
jgi:formate dehydrogenase subunit gamma